MVFLVFCGLNYFQFFLPLGAVMLLVLVHTPCKRLHNVHIVQWICIRIGIEYIFSDIEIHNDGERETEREIANSTPPNYMGWRCWEVLLTMNKCRCEFKWNEHTHTQNHIVQLSRKPENGHVQCIRIVHMCQYNCYAACPIVPYCPVHYGTGDGDPVCPIRQ